MLIKMWKLIADYAKNYYITAYVLCKGKKYYYKKKNVAVLLYNAFVKIIDKLLYSHM